jgi:transposase InsO family protein
VTKVLPIEIQQWRNLFVSHLENREDKTFKEVCEQFNSSRKTGYKWSNRRKQEGLEGLKDKSRVPKKVWNKTEKVIEESIVFLKKLYPQLGTWDIWLDTKDTIGKCEKTIYNILKRHGFYNKPKEKKKCRRYQYKSRNELWHIDITEFKIKGYGKFYIIAIIDDYSRYIVGFGIFDRKTTENVMEVFSKAVKRYGKPIAILSDNGKQFLSRIYKKYCIDNKIKIRKTKPYNPKCNGKIERWFKDLKNYLRKKWFNSPEEFFREVEWFIEWYNKRPKKVLKGKRPKDLFFE